VVVLGRRRSG